MRRAGKQLLLPAYFCLLAVIVFATQFSYAGFYDKHHGWITAHALALADHATPANGFVGYALTFVEKDGELDYFYFDRYPVFFTVFLGVLIRLTDDLATQVFIARQLMHVIFMLTILVAWLFLRRLGLSRLAALVGVTLAFSGYGLLYYRDAVHFDHPALLGMLILLFAIARVKLERRERWRWLTIATLAAVSMGGGFVSLSVPGLWLVLEAAGIMAQRGLAPAQRLRAILVHDAMRMLLLGATWTALMLGYNITMELLRREVPLHDVSIVSSIRRRLPLGHEGGRNVVTGKNPAPPWDEFATLKTDRMLRWYAPVKYDSSDAAPAAASWPLFLLALATVLWHALRQAPPLRLLLLLTGCSGLLFIIAMINLTAHHDYTTMYAMGFALVFWRALLCRLQRHPRLVAILLLAALALFLRSSLVVEAENREIFAAYARYTEDYNRIRLALEARGVRQARIFDTFINHCPIHHSKCFAPGFYLADHAIAEELEDADFVLSDFRFYPTKPWLAAGEREDLRLLAHSLTPDNGTYHLFATADFEPRVLPEGIAGQQVFGGELALGHWSMRDSVQVQPCQRINIESWWQAVNPPAANYSIQLALVNLAGESVGASNDRLTTVNTGVWGPDAWFLDVRPLQIPCDALPGEYPLVLSIYDPLLLQEQGPLPLIQADGSAGDTWLYLTTLFVS